MPRDKLSDNEYRALLRLRTGLRGFLHWSEEQAKAVGLTAGQHQLLLSIRGHEDPRGPTIGEVADYLFIRHHSAVGLVDRADTAGLIRRHDDPDDRRTVRLSLTRAGAGALAKLSALHIEELKRLAGHLQPLLAGLEMGAADRGGSRLVG